MPSINHLPTELIIQILLNLELTSILAFSTTCKRFSSIVQASEDVKYNILLQRTGMISNPSCRQCISSKRSQLEDSARRWSDLRWDESSQKLAQPRTSLVCASSASALIVGTTGEGDSEAFTVGLQTAILEEIVASSNEKLTGRTWTSHLPNMEILEYGLAIETHDLIVPVTWDIEEIEWTSGGTFLVTHLSFVQHSTLQPHPDAGMSSIRFPTLEDTSEDVYPFVRIEIAGDNLAFTVMPTKPGSDGGLLFVLDWKTGRFKAERLPISAEGIAFLRDEVLINANARSNSIDIYYIPQDSEPVVLLRRLRLPSIHPLMTITALDCLSSPNPARSPKANFVVDSASAKPFAADPSLSIIVFTLEICSPDVLSQQIQQFDADEELAKGHALSMVVHRQALLSDLPPTINKATLPTADALVGVDWKSWGPPVTRWFLGVGVGCTSPRGQRCIDNPIGDTQKPELDVLDFNPWDVKLARSQLRQETSPAALVSIVDGSIPAENFFSYPDVFVDDVDCRLPYVRRSTLAPQAHWCTYITEDYLVDLLADEEFQTLDRVVLMKF